MNQTQLVRTRNEIRTAMGDEYWPKVTPVMKSVEQYMVNNHYGPVQAFGKLCLNPELTTNEKKILAAAVVEIGEIEI